ncbi:MAG: DNA adenine methylase [Alphaproteobacteria bacterium]|nr:DNA adenine methylase [Alphaproteobacteria bacterium]
MNVSAAKSLKDAEIRPFLKWAGGKRWLAPTICEMFPSEFGHYIEPFLGGGSIFFHVNPHKEILSDINKELIDTYTAIRDFFEETISNLQQHHEKHCKKHYYYVRSKIPRELPKRAARTIYLNI